MARIRTIKPELAAHEGMFDAEVQTGLPLRFAWCMLFTVADRDGRFMWRVRTLKAQILPHDELDFSRVLDAWLTRGFIRKYRVGEDWYGWIPTFTKHQVINHRESASSLPPIDRADEEYQTVIDASGTREARVDDASGTREGHASGEGRKEGREGKGRKEQDPAQRTETDTGDKNPASRRDDFVNQELELDDELIWRSGLAFIGGEPKRSLMGKLLKQYGRPALARKLSELLAMPESARPEEPATYLIAVMRKLERGVVC